MFSKIRHKHILLWWYRLWIRRDEFHKSLEIDLVALENMNEEEEKKYHADLRKRREIAHRRDIDRYDRVIKKRDVYR